MTANHLPRQARDNRNGHSLIWCLRRGDGGENDTLSTTLLRPIHEKVAWDPPPLAAGARASLVLPVGSKPHCRGTSKLRPTCGTPQKHLLFYGEPQPGDPVSVGLSTVGAAEVMLTAQVCCLIRSRLDLTALFALFPYEKPSFYWPRQAPEKQEETLKKRAFSLVL